MKIEQAQKTLEEHQTIFNEVVKEPNTLTRNVVLAEHRTEIARLGKLISKLALQAEKKKTAVSS